MSGLSRKAIAWAVVFCLLLLPLATEAKEKRGAWLRIEKTDGTLVEGELLKVSGETLVLYDKDTRQGAQLSLSEVRNLAVRRKRSVLSGIAIGLGASIVASQLVSSIAWSDDRSDAAMGFLFLSLYSAPVGMLAGGIISGSRKPYRQMIDGSFQDEDREAILAELRSLSREALSDALGK